MFSNIYAQSFALKIKFIQVVQDKLAKDSFHYRIN